MASFKEVITEAACRCGDGISMRRASRCREAITQIRLAEHLANRVSLIYKAVKPPQDRTCVKLSAADVNRI